MSLFVFQQKIPFQSVIRYLRYFEPGCQTPPEKWAQRHGEDVAPGDILFVFEPIYSPWGDSSTGIGVAEGDSFKAVQLFLILKWETGSASGFAVNADTYDRQAVNVFLAQAAHSAKSNGIGFYYTIVRPNPALSPDRIRDLGMLESYGNSGWRSDDAAVADLPYAFFHAAGYGVEARSGPILDMGQLGFALFCDKEPPAGGPLPDLRRYTAPVYKDARRDFGKVEGLGTPEPITEDVVTGTEPAIPKLPSFFNQMKPGKSDDGPKRNPLAGKIFGGGVPPAPTTWDAPAGDVAPMVDLPDLPPALSAGNEANGDNESRMESETDPWVTESIPGLDAPSWLSAEPIEDQQQTLPGIDPVPEEPVMPTMPTLSGPRVAPPRPSGGLPPVPSRTVPPIPGGGANPEAQLSLPFVSAEPSSTRLNSDREQSSDIDEEVSFIQVQSGDDIPVATPSEPQSTTASEPAVLDESNQPYLVEPPKTPGVEDIMAAIGTSIRETTAAKKQEEQSENATAPRTRPGRAQQQAAAAAAAATAAAEETAALAQKNEEKLDTTSEREAISSSIAPLPPKKRKPDVQEMARAQEIQNRALLKEPMAVKSGVAGLVSKLEQQASKASARLESQVDEIQGRLSDELSRLMNKVSSSERRSAKSAEGLRINLTGKMEAATSDVKSKVNEASSEGIAKIRSYDQSGSAQLDDKHEYLRTALNGSFDEVKARAQTVSKTFEETLEAQSKEVLAGLEETREQLRTQFTDLQKDYESAMQTSFDGYKLRLAAISEAVTQAVEGRHGLLETQLNDLRQRQLTNLEHTKATLLSKLSKQFVVAETEMAKLQTDALENSVLPKLRQHREELRVVTGEFQLKLAEDLDEKGSTKIGEFQPVLEEKKEKLLELLKETTTIKDAIQEQLRERLQEIFNELKEFVDRNIIEAQSVFKSTEEQLADIDRAVRALADPSTIETDIELLNERNSVVTRIDEVTEKAKDDVLNTLRSSVAALEEKGKQLQEELISSMEEDAYVVRRSSEQALVAIREAIRDSFVAIQTAQDERMPM